MDGRLSQSDIEDLLVVCGTSPTVWNAHGNMQVCCPVHSESHPSCGISSEKQVFHCFSCGAKGNLVSMLHLSQPDQFPKYKDALNFIEFNYGVDFGFINKALSIVRYEDFDEFNVNKTIRKEISLYKIAPYKSGKETYTYFFKRGFTKADMEKFMIGRDLISKTVTIPCFYEDGKLAGVIGRYVSRNRKKNERYKVYEGFKRGSILYPIDKVVPKNGTIILVEGCFDAIRLHSLGFSNSVAKMGVSLSTAQANWLVKNCDKVVDLADNDERGAEGLEEDVKKLSGIEVSSVSYPDHGKDVCDWSEEEIRSMLRLSSRVHVCRY